MTSHSQSLSDIAQRNTGHLRFAPDVLVELAAAMPGKPQSVDILCEIIKASWPSAKSATPIYAPKLSAKVEKAFADAGKKMAQTMSRGRKLLAFCESQGLNATDNVRIVNDDFPFARARHHTTWNGTLIEAYLGNMFATNIEDRKHFVIFLPPNIQYKKIVTPHLTVRQIETK
ncbi:MAG: hypothetical protein K5878_01420 [Rhizobiaceae bacterium]|nr:hypothetical protein [Rhizobiaceae bacterium]